VNLVNLDRHPFCILP